MNVLQQRVTPNSYPFNLRADERIELAKSTTPCVKWCAAQGLEVIGLQQGLSHPRVIIRNSPLCESLEGAVHRFERGPQGERRYWFAIRLGCEVRWSSEVAR